METQTNYSRLKSFPMVTLATSVRCNREKRKGTKKKESRPKKVGHEYSGRNADVSMLLDSNKDRNLSGCLNHHLESA